MLRSSETSRDNESILSCYQTDTDSKSEFERLHSNDSRSRSRQSQDDDETSNCDSSSSREILKEHKPIKRSNVGNQFKQANKRETNDLAKLPIKLTLEQNRISIDSTTLPVFDSENSESYVDQLAECFFKSKQQRSDYKTKRKNKSTKILTQSIRILLSNATNVKDLSSNCSSKEFSYKSTIKSTLVNGNVVTYCDVDCKILSNI